jgi:hypothetical protein
VESMESIQAVKDVLDEQRAGWLSILEGKERIIRQQREELAGCVSEIAEMRKLLALSHINISTAKDYLISKGITDISDLLKDIEGIISD